VLNGAYRGQLGGWLRSRALLGGLAFAAFCVADLASASAQGRDCTLIDATKESVAICLPGTRLELGDLPPAVGDILKGNPQTATGLLFQQAAGLTQALNGAVAGISGQVAGLALDLGLADLKGGGPGGGALVNAPLIAGSPGRELSMFAVSGVTSLSHDGYRSSSSLPGGTGTTPAFDETDVGLTVGLRWDASRHFDLDKNSLTFGLIANYTHTDIDLGTNDVLAPFFDKTGSADVDSWSVGTFGLITDGWKYGLLTVTGTFGAPETENYVLGSTADFNTAGIAVSAMSGVLVPLGGSTLDLRGGLNFIHASADNFTDTAGVHFSNAELEEISGTVSARLFRVVRLETGAFRPFIQGGLTQRLHYSNDVDVDGVTFSFDDADTTLFARAGVDFDIDRTFQAYVAVRGDASSSMEAIAAQVGLTFKLD
jgi:hypothetical protein